MFEAKDYSTFTHCLMVFSVGCAYNTVFEYSRKLDIPWVTVAISKNIHLNPPLTPQPFLLYLTLFSLALAQLITLTRCIRRIKNNNLQWVGEIKNWLSMLLGYFIIFLVVLIVYPGFYRILRGW